MNRLIPLVAVALGLAMGSAAHAQDYPAKPVRIIVPSPAGGGTDTMARHIAKKWSEKSGQPVVVENVAGANGNIGAAQVAKSKPDGYTLLMSVIGTHVFNLSLYRNMPYRPDTDLEPIAPTGAYSFLIVTHPSVPVSTVPELVAYAKANPKKLNFGSSGVGSGGHVVGAMFERATNVQFTHVPYKGTGQIVGDLLAGNVQIAFDGLLVMGPHVRAGKLKALALMRDERSPSYPDIPTIAEQGYKGLEVAGWFGLFAPAGVPAPVLKYLRETVTEIVTSKEHRDLLVNGGFEMPPAAALKDFKAFTAAESQRWTPVIKQIGATLD